eukprot:TRINITY_DN1087_c0_g1_i6.p2 TRINITY_DN1087_c0_g1~~TRINITY_DN1087_c0_g1_i6.p2  ORF type:complete len:104 (+),score=21.40 TRINITY_DN1087_c0_g1_i6:157-468(+)
MCIRDSINAEYGVSGVRKWLTRRVCRPKTYRSSSYRRSRSSWSRCVVAIWHRVGERMMLMLAFGLQEVQQLQANLQTFKSVIGKCEESKESLEAIVPDNAGDH